MDIELEKASIRESLERRRMYEGGRTGPRKTDQERIQIIKAYLSSGLSFTQFTEKTGVPQKSLWRWMRKFAGTEGDDSRASMSRASMSRASMSAAVSAADKPNAKRPESITLKRTYMSKKNETTDPKELAALKARISQLERELEIARYTVHARDVLIEEAEKAFDIPIRKKSGAKQ